MDIEYVDIELVNSEDISLARLKIIAENEVKRMPVTMRVEKGLHLLAINETIQSLLQFPFLEMRTIQLPGGSAIRCDYVGQVEIRYKSITNWCGAIVLPGNSEPVISPLLIDEGPVKIPYYKFP